MKWILYDVVLLEIKLRRDSLYELNMYFLDSFILNFQGPPTSNKGLKISQGQTLLNTPHKEHEQMNDLSQFWLPKLGRFR